MTMQNKPQLSAEMEKRFKSWYSECGLDPESDETAAQHQYDGLHFLATALEEQRKKTLEHFVNLLLRARNIDIDQESKNHIQQIYDSILNGDKEMREE